MSTLRFDGKVYSMASLADVLKDAAHDRPDTDDRDHIYNGTEWANRLIGEAAESPLAAEVGEVIARLLLDEDAAVRKLAVTLQYNHKVASAQATIAAMRKLEARGEKNAVGTLAEALCDLVLEGKFAYSAELREFAANLDARKSLLRLYLRYDRPWVLANLPMLFGSEPPLAATILACGLAGIPKAEIQNIAQALVPALSQLPTPVAQSMTGYLQRKLA